jgi:transcriptional regulator with XRE-family HTH domain
VSTRARKIARLKNKAYRDAFIGSQISVGLPFQIRALREQRGWKQSRLATEAGMLQPRISAMESPGAAKFNLETLRRLASAFDVALVVRFVPFGELVDWSEKFNPDKFNIPSFEDEQSLKESARKVEEAREAVAAKGRQAILSAQTTWVDQLKSATQLRTPEIPLMGQLRRQIYLSDVLHTYHGGPYGRLLESEVLPTPPTAHAATVGNRGSIAPTVSIPSVASAVSSKKPPKQETGQNIEQISVQIVPGGLVTSQNQLLRAGS